MNRVENEFNLFWLNELWVEALFPRSSHQVLSIEKAESTTLLPNPVIVSIRTKKAFQLIELQDRNELVESLNSRLRSVQWKQSMFRSRKGSKRSVVRVMLSIIHFTVYLQLKAHIFYTSQWFIWSFDICKKINVFFKNQRSTCKVLHVLSRTFL